MKFIHLAKVPRPLTIDNIYLLPRTKVQLIENDRGTTLLQVEVNGGFQKN